MRGNQVIDSSFKSRRQRRETHRWSSGSRKGYSADIDDTPACPCEDETFCGGADTNNIDRNRFYSDIAPRRRSRKVVRSPMASSMHPDIDVSLVSLITSTELDQRFGFNHNRLRPAHRPASLASSPSSSELNDDECSSSDSNADIRKREASDQPLAVVECGSIELNMSASLLDSIYKIGGGERGSMRIRGRQLSPSGKPKSNSKKLHLQDNTANRRSPAQPCTVSNSRSAEVAAVIASLKNVGRKKRSSSIDAEKAQEPRKKQRLSKEATGATFGRPKFDKATTTLEASISFSPRARVLLCAQAPYTVVHVNAAHKALVQQGLLKPSVVGEAFTLSIERTQTESTEEYISRAVIQSYEHDKTASSQNSFLGNVRIFPVLSSDESFSRIVRSYTNDSDHRPHTRNCDPRPPSREAPHLDSKPKPSIAESCNQYISHYLLEFGSR